MLTPQQIFDRALAHIRKQGRPSMVEGGTSCMYRGAEGTMCPVGCLIPDNAYRPAMENVPVSAVTAPEGDRSPGAWLLRDALLAGGIDVDAHVGILTSLQAAHDNAFVFLPKDDHERAKFMARVESKLALLAKEYGLTYTPPGAQA